MNCRIAIAKAKGGAAAVLAGAALEPALGAYTEAVTGCESPPEINVCGGKEDQPTLRCPMLGKLMNVTY